MLAALTEYSLSQKISSVLEKLYAPVPLFRSDGQAAILQSLRLTQDGVSLTALAERTGLAISHVHGEVERLELAGIVRSHRVGRTRLVSLDPESPIAEEVASLVDKLLGVESLLAAALARVPGIESALVFGSWAARRSGLVGPDPGDVDVLVIGDPDPDDLFDVLREVERVAGRPVNAVVRRPGEWLADESALARSIRTGPTLPVTADDDG